MALQESVLTGKLTACGGRRKADHMSTCISLSERDRGRYGQAGGRRTKWVEVKVGCLQLIPTSVFGTGSHWTWSWWIQQDKTAIEHQGPSVSPSSMPRLQACPPTIHTQLFKKKKTWVLGTQTYTCVTNTLMTEPVHQSHNFKIIAKNSKTTRREGE